ncbi:hypothetical protein CFP56_011808 [Quercus suber]|uniref:Neprosin activation peptide domain-containing protein n=1 Tax=Quercus suber TaxID=58331 RepID=A0AAW0KYK8_QUESU
MEGIIWKDMACVKCFFALNTIRFRQQLQPCFLEQNSRLRSYRFIISYQVNGTRTTSKEEELELERQLKLINKPPVKSIQTEFGSIVDCVDINKQLAFDHPLLKDHKIQERPRFALRRTKMQVSYEINIH